MQYLSSLTAAFSSLLQRNTNNVNTTTQLSLEPPVNSTTNLPPSTTRDFDDYKCTGCRDGYCWSYCRNFFVSDSWCYGTKSYSQSYRYEKCKRNEDCSGNQCNACAGPCWYPFDE